MDIILWILICSLYLISILSIVYIFTIAKSFFYEAPYVPISNSFLAYISKYLDLKDNDHLIDIGSGDGKVLRYINKHTKLKNLSLTGLEKSSILSLFSIILGPRNITYINKSMFEHEYSKYNKVYMYLTGDITSRIIEKLVQEMPKGSIIVSVIFSYTSEIMNKYNIEIKNITINNKRYNIYILKT